jgi:hypothetical protein
VHCHVHVSPESQAADESLPLNPPAVRTVLAPSPCLLPVLNSCLLSPAPPQPTSFRLRLYHLIPSCLRFHIPALYSPASASPLSTSATSASRSCRPRTLFSCQLLPHLHSFSFHCLNPLLCSLTRRESLLAALVC